jgi:hypothetical protein
MCKSPLTHSTDHLTTASRMSSATESSLPTEAVTLFFSSPPFTTIKLASEEDLFDMDDASVSRDEQQVSQRPDSQASQAAHQRTGPGNTERPPSEQQSHDSNEEQTDEDTKEDNIAEEQDGEDSDPADMIDDFDWNDLTKRYHDAMDKCTDEEALLMQEWMSLMEVRRHPALDYVIS